MGRLLFLPAMLLLLMGAAFAAGSATVVSPNGGEYLRGTISVDFNINESTEFPSAILYTNTSPTPVVATVIIPDSNLFNGATITCDDYNFLDDTTCHYSWSTLERTDGNYYLVIVGYPSPNFIGITYAPAYSASSFVIDNTAPVISNPVPAAAGWLNPTTSNLRIDINDNLSGVNASTIVLRFNGTDYNTQSALLSYSQATHTLDFNASTLGLAEGSAYDVNVDANDMSGNAATRYNYIIGVDATGPSVADINIASFDGATYSAAGTGYTNDTATDLYLFASDTMSGMGTMQFSCNNSSWTSTVPYATAYSDFNIASGSNGCGTADGNRQVYARFFDAAGNSSVTSDWIFLDRVAPSTSSDANAAWQTTDANVQLSCTDNALGSGCHSIRYRADTNAMLGTDMGAWATYATGVVFSIDGNFALDYNSVDRAGNSEATVTKYILIDKSAPSTSISPTAWQKADFGIALTCSDANGSGCQAIKYRLDTDASSSVSYSDTNFLAYNSLLPPTITSDGNYAVEYYSIDNVDHNDATNLGYVLLDKTAPAAFTSSSPAGGDTNTVRADWNASSDALSGMQGYVIFRSFSNDLVNWELLGTTTDLNFTDTNSGNGLAKDTNYGYCYKISAFDNANNDTNSAYSCTWLETVPPVMASLSASVSGSSVTLTYSATDTNGSGIKNYWVRKNADAWIYVSGTTYTYTGLANADYNFFAKATDNADHNSSDMNTAATVNVSTGGGSSGGSSGGGSSMAVPRTTITSDANASTETDDGASSETGPSRIPIDTTKPTIPSGISDTTDSGTGEAVEEEPAAEAPTGLFALNEYFGILGLVAILAIIALIIVFKVAGKGGGPEPEPEYVPPKKKWEFSPEQEE